LSTFSRSQNPALPQTMLVVSLSAVARQSAFSGLPDFAFTDDDIGFSFLAIRSLLPEAKGDKKEKNMELREDAIVEIPCSAVRF